jgi:succinoglycan biosynthesis transport protein ExoP
MLLDSPVIGGVIQALRRRRWYLLTTFLAALLVSVTVVLVLPKTYISSGTIGVESQQIPENFVRSTITTMAGERVGMMKARVMTGARLEALVKRHGLYREDWEKDPISKLAERLKSNTWVEVIQDPFASRLGAIAFTISFEHENPETAQAVATELVQMFLDENVATRTKRATETTEFLDKKAEAIGEKARNIDKQLAVFKQKHQNALPEHLELKLAMVSRVEADLRSVEAEIFALAQEKRLLESQNATAFLLNKSDDGPMNLSPVEQLEAKRAELAAKSLKYRPDHWDIKQLKTEIALLEAQVAGLNHSAPTRAKGEADPALARVAPQLQVLSTRMKLLRDQKKALQNKIEQLQAEIMQIPEVEIELRRLTDQYEVYMEEYSDLRAKRYDASLAQSLEQEEKAERFVLLEPPNLPLEPVWTMPRLLTMALAFSLAACLGVVYLAELLDDRIYGRKMLASLTGEPPLAVIPYIENTRPPSKRAAPEPG